jgi:L-amino acid N-acyltransferase YncA
MSESEHKLIIRPTEDADMTEVTDIFRYNVLHGLASWDYEPPDLAEMQRRRETILTGGYPHIVAEWAGKIAGYCYASSYRPRPGYRFVVENSIYVHQDMQRRGVARALLLEVIKQCEARGFRQMIAIIGDSENVPSIKLHEELNFRHAGLLRNIGWKQERWLDSIIMQRRLGDGGQSDPVDEED